MDTGLIVSICCVLGSMFAALCCLKHGRNEYIRYAMILLPYGALLYNAFAKPPTLYRRQRVSIVYCVDYQGI